MTKLKESMNELKKRERIVIAIFLVFMMAMISISVWAMQGLDIVTVVILLGYLSTIAAGGAFFGKLKPKLDKTSFTVIKVFFYVSTFLVFIAVSRVYPG